MGPAQTLITVGVSSDGTLVEFTAQDKYFVAKSEDLFAAGTYQHNWL